jgi:acyl carrier protein
MDRKELRSRMCTLVAESLAVPLEQVRLQSRLVPDLGADSLDFMDFAFALEKEFGIPIQKGELEFLVRLDWSSPEVVKNGHLTEQTIDAVKGWLPPLGDVEDPASISPAAMFSMITVESLCLIAERAAGAEQPHAGGATHLRGDPGTRSG